MQRNKISKHVDSCVIVCDKLCDSKLTGYKGPQKGRTKSNKCIDSFENACQTEPF